MERERVTVLVQRWRNTARDLRDAAAMEMVRGWRSIAVLNEARAAVYERFADELAAVLGLAGEGGDKKEEDADAAVSEHVSA